MLPTAPIAQLSDVCGPTSRVILLLACLSAPAVAAFVKMKRGIRISTFNRGLLFAYYLLSTATLTLGFATSGDQGAVNAAINSLGCASLLFGPVLALMIAGMNDS